MSYLLSCEAEKLKTVTEQKRLKKKENQNVKYLRKLVESYLLNERHTKQVCCNRCDNSVVISTATVRQTNHTGLTLKHLHLKALTPPPHQPWHQPPTNCSCSQKHLPWPNPSPLSLSCFRPPGRLLPTHNPAPSLDTWFMYSLFGFFLLLSVVLVLLVVVVVVVVAAVAMCSLYIYLWNRVSVRDSPILLGSGSKAECGCPGRPSSTRQSDLPEGSSPSPHTPHRGHPQRQKGPLFAPSWLHP